MDLSTYRLIAWIPQSDPVESTAELSGDLDHLIERLQTLYADGYEGFITDLEREVIVAETYTGQLSN